jgi:hypothetical protein
MPGAGGPAVLSAPLRALANSMGGDVARLGTRAVLQDGRLCSAEAPSAAPPVWFVFTGVPLQRQPAHHTNVGPARCWCHSKTVL